MVIDVNLKHQEIVAIVIYFLVPGLHALFFMKIKHEMLSIGQMLIVSLNKNNYMQKTNNLLLESVTNTRRHPKRGRFLCIMI